MAVLPASAASVPPPAARGWPFPAGTHLKFGVLTPPSCDQATQPMGERGSDFSQGEESEIKREEEKGDKHLTVHDLDSRPAATALLSLLLLTA